MSKEAILEKIKNLDEKLADKELSDMHSFFENAKKNLEKDLESLGGEEVKVVDDEVFDKLKNEQKPKAEKKTPPKKKPTKKKPTKKKPTKDEYESAMADLKKKSGQTEEECLEIIEKYRALRKTSQQRKAKENKAKTKKNADEKKRTDKLKEQGKLNEEGTLTPEAVIEQDIPKVKEKAEQEIEQIKEDNTPKPTKEEPKPKPTKQGEKKIKEGVKEVAEDTTKAIQEMLMAILGVVKKFKEPSVAKASLVKLRDALTKEINNMASGGLTDGAVANMNVTQSQMSAESVNPQMYAKGGKTHTMPDGSTMLNSEHYEKGGEIGRKEWEKEVIQEIPKNSDYDLDEAENIIGGYPDYFEFLSYWQDGKTPKETAIIVLDTLKDDEDDEDDEEERHIFEFTLTPNSRTKSKGEAQKNSKSLVKEGFRNVIYFMTAEDTRRSDPSNIQSVRVRVFASERDSDKVDMIADMYGFEVSSSRKATMKGDKFVYAKGGTTQGYNDRMDESLGMRHRGHHSQSHKDRRDEAKGMNKGMGNRAYQSVGSMDKMAKGGSTNANWIQDVVDSPNFDKGAFTRKAKNRGMTTMELMKDVLSNPNEYTLKTRRQAQFMKNAM